MPGGPSGYEAIVLEGEGGSYEEESQDRASGVEHFLDRKKNSLLLGNRDRLETLMGGPPAWVLTGFPLGGSQSFISAPGSPVKPGRP